MSAHLCKRLVKPLATQEGAGCSTASGSVAVEHASLAARAHHVSPRCSSTPGLVCTQTGWTTDTPMASCRPFRLRTMRQRHALRQRMQNSGRVVATGPAGIVRRPARSCHRGQRKLDSAKLRLTMGTHRTRRGGTFPLRRGTCQNRARREIDSRCARRRPSWTPLGWRRPHQMWWSWNARMLP